jgi:D-amino peptidase
MPFKNILIIADIEGSSGCWSYSDSAFMTRGWRRACMGMTADAGSVVAGLFDAGVEHITVVDFHRTGYNLLPERIDARSQVVSGYRRGPVPGIGDPRNAQAILFLGLHAASGTDGFLAHTFTSRLARLEVNGEPMPEVAFFSASVAPYGIRPIFFSGCPIACAQAKATIPQIHVYPIDKTNGPNRFDAESWRAGLAVAAVEALNNHSAQPYLPQGPFQAKATMRDGPEVARKLAQRWGFRHEKDRIYIETADIHALYQSFIRLCYLTPQIEKIIPIGLFLYNLMGRMGLAWVRRASGQDLKNKNQQLANTKNDTK